MEQSIKKSAFHTVVVMVSTAISRLFGFVRIALIGGIFGASGTADVLNAVFTIPNNLRKLMAEGALSSAFIPVLSRSIVQDATGGRARKIVRLILSFQFIVLIPVLVCCVVFSPRIVRLILDFQEPEKIELAARLFRWMIHYLFLVSLSAVLMGVINAHTSFLVPAVTPILFSVAVISAILLLHRTFGPFAMVIGVLAGGVAQVVFQVPKMRALGYGFRLSLDFKDADFVKVMRLWLPVVATASVYTINEQIAIYFATGLPDGSASAMSNAMVFWQLPFGIFSASITTVLFPRMSRQAGAGDDAGLSATLEYGLRYLGLLLIPAAALMSFLAREGIAAALQRGAFTPENTFLTAKVLVAYNLGLFSVGAFNFFQRFFYARDNYKAPLAAAFIVCVLDIVLSVIFKETSLQVAGLALANTVSFTVGVFIMWVMAQRDLRTMKGERNASGGQAAGAKPGIRTRFVLLTLLKSLTASAPAAAFLYFFVWFAGPWWQDGSSLRGLTLLACSGGGALAIILIMYRLMNIDILMSIIKREVKEP